jgi:hypothetical protein
MNLAPRDLPPGLKAALLGEGSISCEAYQSDTGLSIMYSVDKTQHGVLKHLSISRRDRYPGWDEMLEVKNHFFGDIDAMMVMPKKRDYVNISKNCFHIWETPTSWDVL